jgi:hypothetical protein
MKRILLLLPLLFIGCSSVSKETYTEKRILTYPKKCSPHIKEMYLGGANSMRTSAVENQPMQNVVNNDIDYITNPDLPQSVEDIEQENRELIARAQNKMLRDSFQ